MCYIFFFCGIEQTNQIKNHQSSNMKKISRSIELRIDTDQLNHICYFLKILIIYLIKQYR